MQNYSTVPQRVLIRAEMEMLKHSETISVLGTFGTQKAQPERETDTVVFRRVKPFNSNANETPNIDPAQLRISEGTTPESHGINYTDVSVTLEQYGVLYKFSSKAELMYREDIPSDMKEQAGETMGETAELVAYGQVKNGQNVTYANGSTRVGLNSKISLNKLRLIARTMENNRGKRVSSIIKPGPNFDTSAVEPAYVVFIHTDVVADVRDLEGFVKREKYGTATKPLHDREIGACEEFRFVTSPLFRPYLGAGAAVGASGMLASDLTNCDVYPCIVTARDAWGHISLKGHGVTGIKPTFVSSKVKNAANPLGLFGFVGASFWYNSVRLNENWMTRLEVCVTDLN